MVIHGACPTPASRINEIVKNDDHFQYLSLHDPADQLPYVIGFVTVTDSFAFKAGSSAAVIIPSRALET